MLASLPQPKGLQVSTRQASEEEIHDKNEMQARDDKLVNGYSTA